MIYVNLDSGGIGNQLFQLNIYFYLVKIYSRKKVRVFYKGDSDFDYGEGLSQLITTQIDRVHFSDLNLRKLYCPLTYQYKNKYLSYIISQLNLILARLTSRKLGYDPIISPLSFDSFIDFEDLIDVKKDYVVLGLFQSSRYLDLNLKFFKETITLNEISHPIISQIDFDTSLLIHVRGGNFLNSKNHNIIKLNYYSKAINLMIENFEIKKIYVISDDKDYAKSLLSSVNNLIYIDSLDDNAWLMDFNLIKKFGYAIIPNSTYSLWARLLSDFNILTIIPNYFFKSNNIYSSFFLDKNFTRI